MLIGELREKFLGLVNRLSPENLACDGECSKREVGRRRAAIMREWRALEKKVGRRVTEMDLY